MKDYVQIVEDMKKGEKVNQLTELAFQLYLQDHKELKMDDLGQLYKPIQWTKQRLFLCLFLFYLFANSLIFSVWLLDKNTTLNLHTLAGVFGLLVSMITMMGFLHIVSPFYHALLITTKEDVILQIIAEHESCLNGNQKKNDLTYPKT